MHLFLFSRLHCFPSPVSSKAAQFRVFHLQFFPNAVSRSFWVHGCFTRGSLSSHWARFLAHLATSRSKHFRRPFFLFQQFFGPFLRPFSDCFLALACTLASSRSFLSFTTFGQYSLNWRALKILGTFSLKQKKVKTSQILAIRNMGINVFTN